METGLSLITIICFKCMWPAESRVGLSTDLLPPVLFSASMRCVYLQSRHADIN